MIAASSSVRLLIWRLRCVEMSSYFLPLAMFATIAETSPTMWFNFCSVISYFRLLHQTTYLYSIGAYCKDPSGTLYHCHAIQSYFRMYRLLGISTPQLWTTCLFNWIQSDQLVCSRCAASHPLVVSRQHVFRHWGLKCYDSHTSQHAEGSGHIAQLWPIQLQVIILTLLLWGQTFDQKCLTYPSHPFEWIWIRLSTAMGWGEFRYEWQFSRITYTNNYSSL